MTAPESTIAGRRMPASSTLRDLRDQTADLLIRHQVLIGWLAPLAIAVLAGTMRFWNLAEPGTLVFDETYYVKDAYSLLASGYERQWPEGSDEGFNTGDASMLREEPGFVVHPPGGKWLIAIGLAIFGHDSSVGWRFSAALAGTISVFLIGRIGRRLLGSTLLGCTAALLMAHDTSHLAHSRTSLLDVFLMLWVLAGFGAVLVDRDQIRARLARMPDPSAALGVRPWLLVAGICFGAAAATKWSGAYPLALFGIAVVLWTWSLRRRAGARSALLTTTRRDILPCFLSLVPIAGLVYVLAWSGWLASTGAYNRNWAAENSGWWSFLPDGLVSLAHHHRQAYEFHIGVTSEHRYMSHPWGWIVQWRPTFFYYRREEGGTMDCGGDDCASAVTSVGNPVIWWLGVLAIAICLVAWIAHRDWRAAAVLGGLAATWLPWFQYTERTIFTFYTIVMLPFVVLALTYALGLLWGRAGPGRPDSSLMLRRSAAGAVVALALAVFWYFWPVVTAVWIPYEDWQSRMWLPSWI